MSALSLAEREEAFVTEGKMLATLPPAILSESSLAATYLQFFV